MADHATMSGEDKRQQVAISMSSPALSDRSLAGAAASTPRSSKLAPLDSLQKLMLKSPLSPPISDEPAPPPPVPLAKKMAAEFIGTFILMFTVLSAIVADAHPGGGAGGVLGVAAAAGFAVVAVVLAVVDISGSHLNPAVSVAMGLFGHLPPAHVLPYAAAQTGGAAAAAFLARGVLRPPDPGVMASVPRGGAGAGEAFVLELVLTAVLVFVIAAVATGRPAASREAVAVSIAAAIAMNALVGGTWTGPSMNPARTVGAALATGNYKDIWVYLVAPPLGAIAGAGTYKLIKP